MLYRIADIRSLTLLNPLDSCSPFTTVNYKWSILRILCQFVKSVDNNGSHLEKKYFPMFLKFLPICSTYAYGQFSEFCPNWVSVWSQNKLQSICLILFWVIETILRYKSMKLLQSIFITFFFRMAEGRLDPRYGCYVWMHKIWLFQAYNT